ncbi:MAG: histone deacetylase [Bacteroidetes bacterium]|nr:histone deacetylase [Bacteroidota bacterium]
MIYIAFSPYYHHPLPEGHRFPMDKYTKIRQQLIREGTFSKQNFFEPKLTGDDFISLVHSNEYIQKLNSKKLTKKEERRIGFPLSEGLVKREKLICIGNTQAALLALENGVSFNVAGGTHHAHRDFGEGYCLFNDIAVAAQYLLNHQEAKKILVVDLDVHQGNGTASIFANEDKVFTFSMHCENNFPLRKSKSDLDIPLDHMTNDEEYLTHLTNELPKLIETVKPDFIFYQSGVDILTNDKLGLLNVTKDGCAKRDRFVLETAIKHGIPLTASMGGGYADNIDDIVDAHCNTYRIAKELYS